MMRRCGVLALLAAVVLVTPVTEAAKPIVVGEHVSAGFETLHPYQSSGSAQPVLTWTDVVEYPDAVYIAVHFARMDLGDGDYVVVRSPDGAQQWTYTRFGRHDLGATPEGFFATHIK
ncbi:MAG: hypothetical protein ABFS37_13035, partial [Acidobacteriota bacterium]